MKLRAHVSVRLAVRASAFALLAAFAAPLAAQQEEFKPERWEKAIAAFEAADKADPPKPGQALFVGSSTIRLWDLKKSFPNLDAINRGFGGCFYSDVLFYADRIILPYKPRAVALYAGDNDIAAGKTADQVVADFEKIAAKIREALPETKIIFLSIKPSESRWKLVETIREANEKASELAGADPMIEYADVQAALLGPDGRPKPELFEKDKLHVNAEGYKLWVPIIEPLLK